MKKKQLNLKKEEVRNNSREIINEMKMNLSIFKQEFFYTILFVFLSTGSILPNTTLDAVLAAKPKIAVQKALNNSLITTTTTTKITPTLPTTPSTQSTPISNTNQTQNLSVAKLFYTQTRKFNIYATAVIIIIGLFGNGLAVFVFAQKRFRLHSSSIYLLFLAISDGLFLLMHFFEDTLRTYIDVYFYEDHSLNHEQFSQSWLSIINITDRFNFSCRVVNYFRYFLRFISAYIIIVFTIQRTIAIHSPLFQARYESKRIAWLIVFFVTVVGLIINSWVPFVFDRLDTEHREIKYCDVQKKFSSEYFTLAIIYIALIMLIPITVIFFCNTLIMLSIFRASKNRETLSNANKQQQQQPHHNYVVKSSTRPAIKANAAAISSSNVTIEKAKTATSTYYSSSGGEETRNGHVKQSNLKNKLSVNGDSSNAALNEQGSDGCSAVVVDNLKLMITNEPTSVSFAYSHESEETPLRKASQSQQFMDSPSNDGTTSRIGFDLKINNKRRELNATRQSMKSIKTTKSSNSTTGNSSKVNESKVTRMLIIMSLSYAILNLPYFITWCTFFFQTRFRFAVVKM